MSEDTIILYL